LKIRIQNLIVMLALFAGLHQAAAQASFTLASTLNVASGPASVVAADVNGDGKLDLVTANAGGNSISIYTNNGNGIFVSNATYSVGMSPYFVLAADVNNDGNVDLISANNYDNTLSVLTNNGTGGFATSGTYPVGAQPIDVIAVDVNDDGYVDLVSANRNTNTLTVLTNNGSGGFATACSPSVGTEPVSVTAADVNRDGKLDLICANLEDRTVTMLTNSGGGIFVSNVSYFVGANSIADSVIAADLNGDGKPDLAIAIDGITKAVLVMTNNGSGGFVLASSPPVGDGAMSLIAADVNGDGKLDLMCANENGENPLEGHPTNTVSVLTNNNNGVFIPTAMLPVGGLPYQVIAADINGDGKLDLICANVGSNSLSIYTNSSIFPPPTSTPPVIVKPSSHGLVVSWPSASAGWSLQQSPDLTTHWGPSGYSGYTISDDGTNKSLYISTQPEVSAFFRMMHP
jgi:FG-GAP-like repeat